MSVAYRWSTDKSQNTNMIAILSERGGKKRTIDRGNALVLPTNERLYWGTLLELAHWNHGGGWSEPALASQERHAPEQLLACLSLSIMQKRSADYL